MAEFKSGLPGMDHNTLLTIEGLTELDRQFLSRLHTADQAAHDKLLSWRADKNAFSGQSASELLLACAPVLENLIIELYGIEQEAESLQAATLMDRPVFQFRKLFVQRRARRRLLKKEDIESFAELDAWLPTALTTAGIDAGLIRQDRELAIATWGGQLLEDAEQQAEAMEMLTRWCIRAMTTPEGQAAVKGWVSFVLPAPNDHANLVPLRPVTNDSFGRVESANGACRKRDGFNLTDLRMNRREVMAEVDYCIYCHDHDGDFCSRGFPVKKGEPEQGLKVNPLGVTLTGCPLDEKISEMHLLKRDGNGIAALAMIMVDNPMCPATGHRICNDCMKACVYQKQTPVNIPEIETRVLTDVLNLPWGVEIYDLLTRWNPLRHSQYLPKPYNGLKVLVAGMGPAGFTLSHHLLMEGFAVVGIDGLKIEPLPESLLSQPVRNYEDLTEQLGERVLAGFGGVAEYGITVRWDKNFLKLIYLTLMRRQRFQAFGGVRFGGTLTLESAWELGFDHAAIAVGAGLPQALPIPGSLAPGMRMAADFLMALQLTGAAKADSLANLQVRLPAVVIGGGLTGIDTATEVRAYYLKQVEKIVARYDIMAAATSEATVREGLDPASLALLDEYIEHGRAVRAERERAQAAGEAPDFQPLIEKWGGVSIAYRRPLQDSPAYTRNHEEVIKALEEGIYYADRLSPRAAQLDEYGHVNGLLCDKMVINEEDGKLLNSGEEQLLPARTVLVATGARPNIAYFFEHRSMEIENFQYKPHAVINGALQPVDRVPHVKDPDFGPFTSYDRDGKRVTFIGDTHPDFNGNVVKAVASGYRIYPKIVEAFGERAHQAGDDNEYGDFHGRMQDLLQARVESVRRLTRDVIELTVHAPLAAQRHNPAQVFRLQNYETVAARVGNTRLQTETLPLTGSYINKDAGTVSLIVRERGASSKLCSTFKAGDPLILMGPTGNGTMIPENETVLIVGDWLAAAAHRSLGPAYKAKGNKVMLAVTLPGADDVFCQDELEAASDVILWVTESGEPVSGIREQDRAVTGDMIAALKDYADNPGAIRLQDISHLHITADSGLLKRMQKARKGELAGYLEKTPQTTGSIYSTMQCMLKGVCSQCLQWQLDPKTGLRNKAVFACSWQDEPIDLVDLEALTERVSQNRLQEHLSNLWLEHLFATEKVERV